MKSQNYMFHLFIHDMPLCDIKFGVWCAMCATTIIRPARYLCILKCTAMILALNIIFKQIQQWFLQLHQHKFCLQWKKFFLRSASRNSAGAHSSVNTTHKPVLFTAMYVNRAPRPLLTIIWRSSERCAAFCHITPYANWERLLAG